MVRLMTIVLIILIIANVVLRLKERSREKESSRRTATANTAARLDTRPQVRQYSSGLPPIRNTHLTPTPQTNRLAQHKTLPRCTQTFQNIYDYPHCPKCWSSNRAGEAQTVFWRSGSGCFECARKHRFRRNGTLIN